MSDDLLVERLLRVVDEGRRTATYKLALLLGLIDTVAQHPGAEELPTRTLAEEIVEIYYPQVRLYAAGGGAARELRQIAMKSSPPVAAVLRLRVVGDRAGCHTARQVRAAEPNEHARAVDTVEDTFVRYPIPLLQVVGSGCGPRTSPPPQHGCGGRAIRAGARPTSAAPTSTLRREPRCGSEAGTSQPQPGR